VLCPVELRGPCVLRLAPLERINSHPQLRKLALYPLSYRGVTRWRGAPGRTRTCNRRFRKPVRYPLCYRDFAEAEGFEPPAASHAAAR
jgi:hypothetical protein